MNIDKKIEKVFGTNVVMLNKQATAYHAALANVERDRDWETLL